MKSTLNICKVLLLQKHCYFNFATSYNEPIKPAQQYGGEVCFVL